MAFGGWSTGADVSTPVTYLGGAGTQTATIKVGGENASFSPVANVEEFDGSAWANGGNLSTATQEIAACGTQTAALSVGGYTTVVVDTTEEYNGTSWSAGGA